MQAVNSDDTVPHTVRPGPPIEHSASNMKPLSQPLSAPQQPTTTWDEVYDFENAVFEVEGTRFRVPEKPIFDASLNPDIISKFKRSDGNNEEVYMLEGVTKHEFKVLLKLLFPLPFSSGTLAATHTTADWISILQIAKQWCMDAITIQAATQIMNATDISSMRKLNLAVLHNIPHLKRKAYMEFIERGVAPSPDEAKALGTDATIRIFWAREQNLHQYRRESDFAPRRRYGRPRASEGRKFPFDAVGTSSLEGTAVLEYFSEELKGDSMSIDLIDIILKAKQSGVKRWIQDAYATIVKRENALTPAEAERLDPETAIRICQARESAFLGYKAEGCGFGDLMDTEELYQAAWSLDGTSKKRKAAEQTARRPPPQRTRPVSLGGPSSSAFSGVPAA